MKNGGSFHSYVKLPEDTSIHPKCYEMTRVEKED